MLANKEEVFYAKKKSRALDTAPDSFWLIRCVKILFIRVVLLKSVT